MRHLKTSGPVLTLSSVGLLAKRLVPMGILSILIRKMDLA